jgi:tetratricopeptide (TPR) repeat protein
MPKPVGMLVLALLAALLPCCRSGPGETRAAAAGPAEVSPERPPDGVESGAAGSPPPAPAPVETAAPAPALPVPTLPLPERAPPAAAAARGETDAAVAPLPLPALAPSAPLARLNRIPPDLAESVPWPPTAAYLNERADAAPAGAGLPAEAEQAPPPQAPAQPPLSQTPAQPPPPQAPAQPPAQPPPPQTPAQPPPGPAASPGRVILARSNDRVEVLLDGAGWLFMGFDDSIDGEAVSFLSRESERGQTSFIFRVHELGSYTLSFELQDSAAGSTRRETVVVDVLPEEEFDRRLSASRSSYEPEEPAADYRRAEQLFSRGELELALIEFIRNYREDDGYATDRIAAIYLAGGEYEAALKYYRKNLDAGAPEAEYRDRAVLGALRAGLGLKDADLVLEFLEDFLALRSLPIAGELVDAAGLQLSAGRHASARLLLREYRARYPRGERMDEVLFLLGRLYEQDSPLRDLEASRAFYQRVWDEYPESLLADEAWNRLRYLDRHFFHVQ